MVQVLHLTSHPPDFQAGRTAETIRLGSEAGITFTTRTIGPGGTYRSVLQAAMSLRFGQGTLFDVVHAWDLPSLLAGCGSPSPLVFSPSLPPAHAPAWLAAAMVYRNGTVIATTPTMRRRLIRQGIPAQRCHLIPPAVDPSRIPMGCNETLRARLGIAPDDRVILAPGESNRAAAHLLALHTVSILHVLDPRYRLLTMGEGSCARGMIRLADRLRQPRLLVQPRWSARVEFEGLLGCADLALVAASDVSASLPIAMCMAAGLPIVAAATPANLDLVTDGYSASLVARPTPRLLGQRALELFEDPARMRLLGAGAKTEMRPRFNPTPAEAAYASLYRRAAGVGTKTSRFAESSRKPQASVEGA